MTGCRKGKMAIGLLVALVATWAVAGTAAAQSTAPATTGAPAAVAAAPIGFDTLKGAWVRPDGGYRIVVRGIGASGQIEAMYYNPTELPFAKAQASMQDAQLRVFLELRAGGYNGSTYDLVYDPASDRLKGVYSQAVVKQKFDVYFVRK